MTHGSTFKVTSTTVLYPSAFGGAVNGGELNLQTQLGFTPAIKAILNYMTTQLKLRVTTVPNANSYEAQYRIAGGAWVPCGAFPNSRKIIITGLVPGVMYEFRVRAVGGLTNWSAWSDTASHMCM